jgi:hypothetical protein
MRLGTLEAEIWRIAAVLRATLRASEPAESDLRRLWATTTLSQPQLRKMVDRFIDKVVDGFHVNDAWKAQMIETGMLELPEEPTPNQIDAWNEIIKSRSGVFHRGDEKRDGARVDLPTSTNAVAIAR